MVDVAGCAAGRQAVSGVRRSDTSGHPRQLDGGELRVTDLLACSGDGLSLSRETGGPR